MIRSLRNILLSTVLLASFIPLLVNTTVVFATEATYYSDADPETSSCDGYVGMTGDDSWNYIRLGAGSYADDDGGSAYVMIQDGSEPWQFGEIARGFVFIDTSALPDNAIITAATLSIYGTTSYDDKSIQPNINVYSAISTSANTSLAASDYFESHFGTTAFSSSISYSSWNQSGWNTFTLNSSGIAGISLTGITKFGLREVAHDVNDAAPAFDEADAYSYIAWYTADHGSAYRPKLTVTYYTIASPSISVNDASNIAETTARLNSTLNSDGNDTCEVRFGYGDASQLAVNFEDYDVKTSWVDGFTTGQHPYVDVSSLESDTSYYYRVQARNDAGTTTSTSEASFTTESSFAAPTNFRALPSASSVALSWTKGLGSSTTLVRYSFDTNPTATDEGEELYSGAGSTVEHTGLSPGTTIYYSAWGESAGEYTVSYAEVTITTLAGVSTGSGVDLVAPTAPSNWFLSVDYSTQDNNPFYPIVNGIADGVHVPRNTAWMLAAIFVSMIGGALVYVPRKSLLGAMIAMVVLMGVASAQMLIPGYMMLLAIIMLIVVGITHRSFG